MWTDEEIEEAERQLAEEDGGEKMTFSGQVILWTLLIVFLLPQFGFFGDGNILLQGFKGLGLVFLCFS